jgi:type IV pilus assembly protein PilF
MRRPSFLASIAIVFLAAALASGCETTTLVNGKPVATPSTGAESQADARKRAEIRLQLAATYYQKGQFAVALDETKLALQADPGYAAAYGLRGLIYMELADRAEAESNFQRALRLDPDNPELANNYGWYLCQTGRERDSIAHFKRAVENRLYQTPGIAMQNAGLCMLKVNDLAAAEQYLKRSFELDASNPITKFQLANLYLRQRKLDRASFYYELLTKSLNPTAEILWLGVRIAHAGGDVRTERQLADEMRRAFPKAHETALLNRGAFDE